MDFRASFYVAGALSAFLMICCFVFIYNKQERLKAMQLEIKHYYSQLHPLIDGNIVSIRYKGTLNELNTYIIHSNSDSNNKEKLDSNELKNKETNDSTYTSLISTDETCTNVIDMHEIEIDRLRTELKWIVSKDYRFPLCMSDDLFVSSIKKNNDVDMSSNSSISRFQWFLTMNLSIQTAFSFGIESMFVRWYIAYMSEKYGSNIIISAGQLSVLCLFYVSGMQVMKFVANNMQKRKLRSSIAMNTNIDDNDGNTMQSQSSMQMSNIYDFKNIFVSIALVCYVILIIFACVICPFNLLDPIENDSYVAAFWFYVALNGWLFGMLMMCQEMILLEVQPKHISGRVNGLKGAMRQFSRGFWAFMVGVMWDYNVDWFFYMQAVNYASAFVLMLSVVAGQKWYNGQLTGFYS